ncbi:MAG TPA: hypothetical protein [Caudoviricetes sp.]|nr:MAG TPA: hypothetical protein [Caudoviricetes sp.]
MNSLQHLPLPKQSLQYRHLIYLFHLKLPFLFHNPLSNYLKHLAIQHLLLLFEL